VCVFQSDTSRLGGPIQIADLIRQACRITKN
jgi:hypothetical protein